MPPPPRLPEFIEWTCCKCGVRSAMPAEVAKTLRQSSATFYCLFGHSQHYPAGKSREEIALEKLDKERLARQRAEQRVAQYIEEAEAAKASSARERARAAGYKRRIASLSERAKGGACPCCNRYFIKLHKHMATKHPGFPVPYLVGKEPALGEGMTG